MDQSWEVIQEGLFHYPLDPDMKPVLIANRCAGCGKTFFPRRSLCPHCFEEGVLEDISLNPQGVIYACTVVHIPSPAGIKAPYAYGYVHIPKNKIRIFGLFTGADPFTFTPGQEVELVVEPVRENHQGQNIIGYKFKPIP